MKTLNGRSKKGNRWFDMHILVKYSCSIFLLFPGKVGQQEKNETGE